MEKEFLCAKYHIKRNFGKQFTEADISSAVLLMRHQWKDFYDYLLRAPPNPIFLAFMAFQFLDEGDVEIFEKLVDILPNEVIYMAANTFKDKRFVFFK
jgi:hypothetical protein